MNQELYDDPNDDLHASSRNREFTLSTGTVLAIFFGLALICALFFGFGYNMGRRPTAPIIATDGSDTSASTAGTPTCKPAAGSAVEPGPIVATGTALAPVIPPAANSRGAAPIATPTATTDDVASSAQPAPITRVAPTPLPAPLPDAGPVPAGSFIVQVAAVSHQEDADLLVNALHRKGYAVAARSEPQDKLVHIQVGPFNNRKDADAMRQRLLSDGYNAIVK
jgi:DedD protein